MISEGSPAPETPLRGCLKNGMLGCGGAVLAGILAISIAGAFVASNPRRSRMALASLFDTVEKNLLSHGDASVTDADRQEFERAYSRFRTAWVAGRMGSRATDELRQRMMNELQKDHFRGEDLRSLARFLEGLARGAQGPAPAAPPAGRTTVASAPAA